MPKIKITEIDNTGLITREGLSNVVYIPGKSVDSVITYQEVSTKPDNWATTYTDYYMDNQGQTRVAKADVAPVFSNLGDVYSYNSTTDAYAKLAAMPVDWSTDFDTYYKQDTNNQLVKVEPAFITCYKKEASDVPGTYSAIAPVEFRGVGAFDEAEGYNKAIPEYKIARKLISMGLPVLYEQIVTDMTSTDWDKLADKNQYDIRFLTVGIGVCNQEMIEVAAKRGDCIALLHNSQETSATTVVNIRSNIETLLITGTSEELKKNSFAAAFTPWFTVDDDGLKDVIIPAEYGYLMAYAESIRNNPEWYAAAGSFRGIIPNIKDVMRKYSSAEVEQLQGRGPSNEVDLDVPTDNSDFAINPITNVTPFGIIVWGNRTLLKPELDEVESVGILKATSFLNVRNLVSAVKKQLYITSKKYTFEQNSDVLWVNFKSGITPLLDQMQSGNGIVGYKIVKLPTNKKARLAARITIIPIEAVEDFELEVELTDSLEVIE